MAQLSNRSPQIKRVSMVKLSPKPVFDRQPSQTEVVRADRLWSRMAFEVNLMTARTNWMITSQSFLFAAFFLGSARFQNEISGVEFFILALPIVGIAICAITLAFVNAATLITVECRKELAEIKSRYPIHFSDRIDNHPGVAQRRFLAVNLGN